MLKRNILIFAGILLLFIFFCGSSDSNQSEIEKNKVTKNIIARCNILNDYYTGKKDYDDTYKKLAEIESQRLFSDDISYMDEYSETDFDVVKVKKIIIEDYKESAIGLPSGEITVIYKDGDNIYSVFYFFSAEINNKKLKLTNLEKI